MFGMKSIYLGYSFDKFNEIRHILDINNINYKVEYKKRSDDWLGHGNVRGNFPMTNQNMKYDDMYEIFVKKKEFDKAMHFITNTQ